ncbi:hypothetical protein VC0101557_18030 [Vibrio cholerae VC0101557]|uniref:Uncharacterized protein n=5 Tax=Vibrio TaxID=662 RepID=Q9KTC4_VIBCH|nr:hypothetical protein VC_0978 [Vibrio cholerae O1 biovar El Tor str. N16961]ABQ20017.1 hypothetical protein VC0395_A0499 [Vibrio cholerae O395]ACP05252.1 conserved hypothetical protein [Vibrio cholerae M66-2]ACQ61520.1 hypothetical protein VCD_003360 [Vibrio cholerae MJ-1236]AEA78107.1 hypothetical protein VCLMA_A0836 [Vibrio cholerae LMA3984-4]AET26090.1 conserved hypothetical protein [Vibrio cholerae O1 str. 2010EL-1786]APF48557.1 hypothetical protein ASZ80_01007 [Vibrio cholerae]EAZ7344
MSKNINIYQALHVVRQKMTLNQWNWIGVGVALTLFILL